MSVSTRKSENPTQRFLAVGTNRRRIELTKPNRTAARPQDRAIARSGPIGKTIKRNDF